MKTIDNMKDIKELLNKVPDEVLEDFSIAYSDDGLGLACYIEGEEEENVAETVQKHMESHQSLKQLDKYITAIIKAAEDEEEEDRGIVGVEVDDA